MARIGQRASPRIELARYVEVPARPADDGHSVHRASDDLAEQLARHPGRQACPLIKAVYRIGDDTVSAAIVRMHPPTLCPAAKKQWAA
jgi:hypothetical protein